MFLKQEKPEMDDFGKKKILGKDTENLFRGSILMAKFF